MPINTALLDELEGKKTSVAIQPRDYLIPSLPAGPQNVQIVSPPIKKSRGIRIDLLDAYEQDEHPEIIENKTKILPPDPNDAALQNLQKPVSSIAETGLPEKPQQIAAQFKDMLDPNTGRDSIFVGATTPDPAKNVKLPKSIFKIDSPAGTLYTTNKAKADEYTKNPTDETRAKILGYTQSKKEVIDSGKTPQAVIVTDPNGNRIFEEVTTEPDEVIAKYKKQGYKNITTEPTINTVLKRLLPAEPQDLPTGWEKNIPQPKYGLRADGTPKGKGFFGELKMPDGRIATEISIGVNFNGKETQIPTLVPTLTEDEKKYLLQAKPPTKAIIDKAIAHAKKRIAENKSPFAQEGEQIQLAEKPQGLTAFEKLGRDIKTIGQAAKVIAKQPYKEGEITDIIRNVTTRAFSPLAYLIPGLSRKELIASLDKEAEQFTGFGPALAPAAGETGQLTLEMATFQKAFGAVSQGAQALGKIPAIEKVAEAANKMGGVRQFAEKFPRIFTAMKTALKDFMIGDVIGTGYGALKGVDEGSDFKTLLKQAGKEGLVTGAYTGAFSVAGSIDRAKYIKALRVEMLKRFDTQLRGQVAQINANPNIDVVSKTRAIRGLESYRNEGLRYIDNTVAAVENDLIKFSKGELYPNIRDKVINISPTKAAERFLKYGLERPQFGKPTSKVRPVPQAPEALKTGMGVIKPTDVLANEPATRAGEILKAVTHPVETVKEAIKEAKGNIKPQSGEELTRQIRAETPAKTVKQEAAKVWIIKNSRGQQFGVNTYPTREIAQKALESKITAPMARTQFYVEETDKPFGKETLASPIQTASAKQPYEMTKEEFDNEFWFHGKGAEHPYKGQSRITGGVTKIYDVARGYSGNMRNDPFSEKGEIALVRYKDLPIGARQELAQRIREQRILGYKKPNITQVSGMGAVDAIAEFIIPSSIKNPHKYFIQQALSEGKTVPTEVLAEYPELGKGEIFEKEPIEQKPGEIYSGSAYRVPTRFINKFTISKETAADVIRYEQEGLGNDYGIAPEQLKELEKLPASDLIWVGKTKKDVVRYAQKDIRNKPTKKDYEQALDVSKDVVGGKIIGIDAEGGYLVLKPSKAPATQPEGKEEKSASKTKTVYTDVPEEWHNIELMDWGKKGLRRKGNGKGRKNVFPYDPANLQELPTKLPRATMNRIKELSGGEFWSVGSIRKPSYYLAPKKVIEQVKTELGEEAFNRMSVKPRSARQILNDQFMSMKIAEKNKQVKDYEIGERLLELATEDNIPTDSLPKSIQEYIIAFKEYQQNESESQKDIRDDRQENQGEISQDLDPDNLTDEQWLAIQDEQRTADQIGDFLDGLEEKSTTKEVHPELVAMRQSTLPEYNTNSDIIALDAFVDKIRVLNPKDELDAIHIKQGNKYEATVSYPHSLGENGNATDFVYKEKPTVKEIKTDILDTYEEFKADVNKEIVMGIVAKSGRDENIEAAIDEALSRIKKSERPKDLLGREELQGGVSGKQKEMFGREDFKTEQAKQQEESKRLDIEGQAKLPETPKAKTTTGKIQSSVGAAKDIKLDRTLNRAAKQQDTIYTIKRKGEWANVATPPLYGDYFITENGETGFVEGDKIFGNEREAIVAAQNIADSTKTTVYVAETSKGFELLNEKPKTDYVEILPSGEGLTADEKEMLGTPERKAEAEILQQEGKKIGYKEGQKEALREARNKLNDFKLAVQLTDINRRDAADIVIKYVPKEKQANYINRILNAKTDKRVRQITEAIELYVEAAEKRLAVRELKNFIEQVRSDYKNGRTVFGRLPKAVRVQFTDFLDKYDLTELSETKADTLKSREEYIKRIIGIRDLSGKIRNVFESFNFEEGIDEDAKNIIQMGDARIAELKRLNETPIKQLDTSDIKFIHKSLEELIRVNELKGSIKERVRAEKLRDGIKKAVEEIYQRSKVLGEETKTFPTINYLVKTGQAQMDTLIGFTTGKDNQAAMDILYNKREQGQFVSYGKYRELVEYIQKRCKDIGYTYKTQKGLDETVKITLGGKIIDLPIRNLAVIYAHSRNPENLSELLKSKGLVINITKRNPKTGYLLKSEYIIRTNRLTPREIKDAISKLPDIYKKLVDDVMFDTNKKAAAPMINEASMRLENYELADAQSNYTHISRETESKVEGGILDTSTPPEKRGRAIARTGGKNRIFLESIDNEIIQQAQFAAEYSGMTEPLRDARTLLANKNWREKMKQAGNGDILRQMETLFRRAQGVFVDKSILEKKMGGILRSYGQSVLSLRLSGGLVQLTSPPAAFGKIEPQYFIAAKPLPLPSDIETLKNRRPDLWYRWQGKAFDFVLGDIAAAHAFESMIFDKTPFDEKLLGQYTWGDEISIYKVFKAAERKIASESELKRGTPEFDTAVDELFSKAMRGQGQFDMLHRSDMTSSPNVFLKGSALFMSTNNAFYNTLMKANDNLRKGRIGIEEYSRAVGGVAASMAAATTIRLLFIMLVSLGYIAAKQLLFGGDKEKYKIAIEKEFWKRVKSLPMKIVFNMAGLSMFGQIFSSFVDKAITNYNYVRLSQIQTGNIFADLVLDFGETAILTKKTVEQFITKEKYKSGKKKGKSKWIDTAKMAADDIVSLIALRYGLPYSGPKSDFYYPIKSAESTIKKSLTKEELKAEIQKRLRKEGGNEKILIGTDATGKKLYRQGPYRPAGTPHKGEEDKVKELRAELKSRK